MPLASVVVVNIWRGIAFAMIMFQAALEDVPGDLIEAARMDGATAVQVGTANFVDPFIWTKLLDGIREYLERQALPRVSDLTGTIDTSAREKSWISS